MASKRRKEEETFEFRPIPPKSQRKKKSKKSTSRPPASKKLTEGWFIYVIYIILGIGLALVTKQLLAVTLSTDMPVVAVVSPSMQHDNAEVTHYDWLADRLGYNVSYINSWPAPKGFMIGDMPIVKGEPEYKVGDVIVYSVLGEKFPIIHRIIKINEDGTYQTKGDNNRDQLPYEFKVTEDKIYGKVLFVIPKLGYLKVIITKLFGAV